MECFGRKEKARKSTIYGLLNNFDLSISGDGGIRTTGRFFGMWLFELIGALFTNYFTGTKAVFGVFRVPAGTKLAHENTNFLSSSLPIALDNLGRNIC